MARGGGRTTVAELALWLIGLLLVTASGVAVAWTTFVARQHFLDLQEEQRRTHELEVRWGRLLLEQGALMSHVRIERQARERLNMVPAGPDLRLLVVEP